MGERGRLPQPDNVRQLRGNPGRRKPRPAVRAVAGTPGCPTWLDREARAEWKRVTPELERLGVLARIDRAVLTMYCRWWSRWVELDRQLKDVRSEGRHSREATKSPLWQPYREAADKVRELAKELYLTPNARARTPLKAPAAEDESDLD